jgi:distribution and morphology protein 12
MSIDIQWETLTGGVQGEQLAEKIRVFIHDRFQQVPLPRFIRSVKVHSFDFGSIPPDIEVKDVCDPHPDFYEDDEDDGDDAVTNGSDDAESSTQENIAAKDSRTKNQHKDFTRTRHPNTTTDIRQSESSQRTRPGLSSRINTINSLDPSDGPLSPILLGTTQTAGIPGGTSNLTYFHLPYGPGLSGATTPLAAVAGGQFHTGWPDMTKFSEPSSQKPSHQHSASISSITSSDPTSRPTSQHIQDHATLQYLEQLDQDADSTNSNASPERDPTDLQVVSHVKYSGDMNLVLTAEILLDYPMPSFVGVPFQLHITGFTFDGVSILAYAKRRLHFCFLSPEEAKAFLGPDNQDSSTSPSQYLSGGLLEEIRVESEIGQKENGKQVLKNVGKVEKFILEQVRRIFENEFVFPSYWTFLV